MATHKTRNSKNDQRFSLGATIDNNNRSNTQFQNTHSGKANFFSTRSRAFSTLVSGDYDTNQSMGKTGAIERYMNARTRLTEKAKEHVEKLNKSAMDRIKYSALYE
jgi:hypothetical protein